MTSSFRPNWERVLSEIAHLGTISDAPPPVMTRILYTSTDMAARRYLIQQVEEAGLTWRTDALGNWFVRLEGTDPALPAVATGSHTDAIPHRHDLHPVPARLQPSSRGILLAHRNYGRHRGTGHCHAGTGSILIGFGNGFRGGGDRLQDAM